MDLTEVAYYIAPLMGLVTFIIGVCAFARPQAMALKFGIPASGLALPYVVSTGIRDVFMGLSILILYFLSDWQALGAIILCIAVVALSDFLMVRKHGDRKTSYVHLAGAVAVTIYGTWLLLNS